MERPERGEAISGIGMGTLRRDTPGKVEVRPHVKEGEREAEEEGFEEVARPPMPSPISHLLPNLPQLNPLLSVRHLKTVFITITFVNALNLRYLKNHLFICNVELYLYDPAAAATQGAIER